MFTKSGIRILLILVTVLVFLPGLAGEFIWDDVQLIEKNPLMEEGTSFSEIWTRPFLSAGDGREGTYYRPVVTLANRMQYRLFGGDPLGFHIVSLLLHLCCVLLVFDWLLRRVKDQGRIAILAAGFGTALFALHPSRPESVTWIAGSTDLWMSLWVMLALWVWDRRRDLMGAVGVSVLLILAVLSKETAVMVPIILALDMFYQKGEKPDRRWAHLGVICLLVLGVAAFRIAIFPPLQAPEEVVGAAGIWLNRVLSAMGHYVGCTLWPWEPSTQVGLRTADVYGVEQFSTDTLVLGALSWGVFVGLCVAAMRWKRPRGVARDSLWFLMPLVPVLQIVPLGTQWLVAYRYLYFPILGVSALLTRLILRVPSGRVRMAVTGLTGVFLAMSIATTLTYEDVLISEQSLWTYEVNAHPNNHLALMNLGDLRWREGATDEATVFWLKGYDLAREAHDRNYQARLALRVVRTMLIGDGLARVSDADQVGLNRIRSFYEQLERDARSRLEKGGRYLDVDLRGVNSERGRFSLEFIYLPKAIAAIRTLRLEEASRELNALVASGQGTEEVWIQRIWVEAYSLRWKESDLRLREATKAYPSSTRLKQVAQKVEEARKAQTIPLPPQLNPEVAGAIRDTLALVNLRAYEQARRTLAPVLESHPSVSILWEARADVDRRDGRLDLMLGTYVRASKNDRAKSEMWNARIKALQVEMGQQKAL